MDIKELSNEGMTRREACERFPLPKGELTQKQREYYERMQAIEGCAYYDGYRQALIDVKKEINDKAAQDYKFLLLHIFDWIDKKLGLK